MSPLTPNSVAPSFLSRRRRIWRGFWVRRLAGTFLKNRDKKRRQLQLNYVSFLFLVYFKLSIMTDKFLFKLLFIFIARL